MRPRTGRWLSDAAAIANLCFAIVWTELLSYIPMCFKPHTRSGLSHPHGVLAAEQCLINSSYWLWGLSCRSSEYAAAKEAFDSAYTRQEAILQKIKPHSLIEALGVKATEVDEEAERLHEEMMQKKMPIEAFMGPFVSKKKLFHQRELKQQAAQQILWVDLQMQRQNLASYI